jgi:hypothetical protein
VQVGLAHMVELAVNGALEQRKVQRFRLFGQLPGRNKLKGPGSRLLV